MTSKHTGRTKDILQERHERWLSEQRVKRFAPMALAAMLRGHYKRVDRLRKEREECSAN